MKSYVERSMLRCLSPNWFSLVICALIKIRSFSGYAQIRGSQQL